MSKRFTVFCLSISMLGAFISNAHAEVKHDQVAVSDWGIDIGLGYAAIENPLNKRDSFETPILPQWYYYGERFYMENLEVGYSLFENEKLFIDLVGYLNDDGVLFNSDDATLSFLDVSNIIPRKGIPIRGAPVELSDIERDFTYMGGAQLVWMTDYFDLKIIHATDITAGHDGTETQLSLQKSYQLQDVKLYWDIGVNRKSDKLNNYYYGIRSKESGFPQDITVTSEHLNSYHLKLAVSYRISPRLSGVISLNHTWLANDLLISPLLLKDTYLSGFVGLNVHF